MGTPNAPPRKLPPTVPNLANAMREARRAAGKTQPQVAEKIGVSKSAVHLWEMNVQNPTLPNFLAYARAVGTTGAALLRTANQ